MASELTVDALAQRAALPVRTIREYQTLGLLPSPQRRGRVGLYGEGHVSRLQLIGRLQARGYSLAGIGDLLNSWRHGEDLAEVLGIGADQLVHVEEPGAPASLEQLTRVLPDLVPRWLDELVATGVVEECDTDLYCVPSPSVLQLIKEAMATGYSVAAVLELLHSLRRAADIVADAAVKAIAEQPATATPDALVAFANRARPLLAHGTGRLAIHAIGTRLGIADEGGVADRLHELASKR